MAEEGHDQTEEQRTEARRPPIIDTMEDFWRPIIQEEYSAIRQPTVDANNFELKPALITMVQQHQFTGHPTEDPNKHLGRFLRMANTVKLNGVRPEVIKLHLFPFSLRDLAAIWYESLPYGSVDMGRVDRSLFRQILSPISHFRETKRDNCIPTSGR